MRNLLNNIDLILKIIDVVLKLTPILFVILMFFKTLIEYSYSNKMEMKFNVPYKYFFLDWKKSLLETFIYSFLLAELIAFNYFLILYRNGYTDLRAISITFVMSNTIYICCTFLRLEELKSIKILKKIVVILIVSYILNKILVEKKCEQCFWYFLIIYSLICIILLFIGIKNYFKKQLSPNKKYEIIKINDEEYIILSNIENKYIVKKKLDDINSIKNESYLIIDDITNKEMEYKFIYIEEINKKDEENRNEKSNR